MPRNIPSRLLAVLALAAAGQAALAAGNDDAPGTGSFEARLDPLEVVPSVSSRAQGWLALRLDRGGDGLHYELRYQALEGRIAPVQLRFGQPGVSGGVVAWLCGTDADPGPAGTPACPASPGTLTGRLGAEDVVGPAGQGIAPGNLGTVFDALRDGLVYASVSSSRFPGGEARGQLRPGGAGAGPSESVDRWRP